MAWQAVVVDATGELVSIGTVIASPLPRGLSVIPCPAPDGSSIWDVATRSFVAAPVPVVRNRIADIMSDVDQALSLTTARRTQLLAILNDRITPDIREY